MLRICWMIIQCLLEALYRYLLRLYFIGCYWIFFKQMPHVKTLNPENRSSEMKDPSEFTRNVVYLEVVLLLGTCGHGSNPSSATSACGPGPIIPLSELTFSLNSILWAPAPAEREALFPGYSSKSSLNQPLWPEMDIGERTSLGHRPSENPEEIPEMGFA